MNRNPVDIIIPVFNAYDDLVLCMRSIRKYTDLTTDRVVIVNDCSTDERILPFIEAQTEENILFINNEMNKGFSNNVNMGMCLTEDRDVLLLNSDTIVTKNWLDKIINCAYSAQEIGTVTPLSNSATLCSIPVMCQDNAVPENVSIDEYASIVEHCSLRHYPKITTAVGFCMFIKREVIKKVGLFDAETFQKGYGEENDFCYRAELLGYIHVLCDDTFIYHKGTVSFKSEEKKQLIASHDAVLEERYPIHVRKNHLYCVNNPDQYIRDNINLFQRLHNNKKNILYVVHSDFREDSDDHIGGTQFHVRDMVMSMRNEYNVFVLGRTGDRLRLTVYNEKTLTDTFEFEIGNRPEYPVFRKTGYFKIYDTVLRAFKIDLVHIHHIYHLGFDIFYAAYKLGIPIHITLHDFYFICPNEKMMNYEGYYCGACEETDVCKKCLKKTRKIADTVDFILKWRRECLKALQMCEMIYTPSESTRDIFLSVYSELKEKIIPIYHGSELECAEEFVIEEIKDTDLIHSNYDFEIDNLKAKDPLVGWAVLDNTDSRKNKIFMEVVDSAGDKYYVKTTIIRRPDVVCALENSLYEYCGFRADIMKNLYRSGTLTMRLVIKSDGVYYGDKKRIEWKNEIKEISPKRFNIAFIGGLVPAKGSGLAYEMITREKEYVNWYIFGDVYDERLSDLEQENLINVGKYERERLPELLSACHIDIVCILAIWPETFSYTVSEALICKIPVLVTDIGALGERVRKNGCGWIVDKDSDPQMIVDKIIDIADDKADYMQKKQRSMEYREKTLKEMAKEYQKYYESSFVDGQDWDYDREMIAGARV